MIYIDVSAAVHSRAGLGRYSESLARALISADPGRFALFYNGRGQAHIPTSLQNVPQRTVRPGYKPWRSAILMAQLTHISFDRLVPDASLFHSTEHLLMPMKKAPVVLTVHDLIYKLFPEYHKRLNYWYLNLAMPLFCKRAQAIIAVSEATKRDIVTHYDIDPAKIHVIYEAAEAHFRPPPAAEMERVRKKYHLPDRFLIHLGTIEPRKNLTRLLDALTIVRRSHPEICLILAGSKGWLTDTFFTKIEELDLEDVVRPLGWVPDADLPAVIAAAVLAVQPSLYEGFGLPILEHMACGQVVAASNSGSHPEIGGQAAAYFDPLVPENMTQVIVNLLDNQDDYNQRRILGIDQAKLFSWRRAAIETNAVYDKLLDQSP
jgi:glycosyltransferase involved in cell wall biosynthesis